MSWLLRAAVFLLPVAAGVLAARAAADWLPTPAGPRSTVVWWVVVLVAATVALVVVERLARRLLPLAWLLRMSLLFPTKAPRRWRLARTVGSVHGLKAQLLESRARGLADDGTQAAQRILTLITALQAHDGRTRGHAERVRVYTDMLTEELGLPTADRDRIRWAALLHDIGKLAISAQLLNKSGALDDEEWRSLRRHPEEGARFCGPLLAWLGPWGDTIIQHHEKYGGGGYPAGLSGEQISLGARIVAVPDAYEVMTSPRAYKRAISPRAAREELTQYAGVQFDPAIVRAFLNLSTRRLQWVAGPAAWLAQLPFVNAPTRVSPSSASLGLGLAAIVALALSAGVGPLDVADIAVQEAGAAEAAAAGSGAHDSADDAGRDIAAAPFPGLAPEAGVDPDADLSGADQVFPDLSPAGGGPNPAGGGAGADDDDDPIVVILPVPDAPEAPAPDEAPDPVEPEEPIVVVVPAPDPEPTEDPEPTGDPGPTEEPGPIIIIIPPPDPTPAPEPSAPSEPTVPTSPQPQPDPPPSPPSPPPPSPSPSAEPTAPPPPPPPPPPPAPPVAVADAVTVERRDSVTIDVLANDGGDLALSTLTVVSQPQHGSASVAGGTVLYVAQPGWSGTVAFSYQVCGVDGTCSTGSVTVTVMRDGPQQGTVPLPLPLVLGGAALGTALRHRRRT